MTNIPPEIERKINQLQSRIQQAGALEQARRVDEAQAAYQACLQMAAYERIPLLNGELVQIWMGLGFCAADRSDWRQALVWYHRAEAMLLAVPLFNANPKSPEAQAHAKQWSPYVPEGVIVVFRQQYPAEAHLATLYDSIALAYDNDNQLERANEYYQRSIDSFIKLGEPAHEADVRLHQAIGCQRRQQWFDLEQSADKLLLVAERAQIKPLMLAARRYLTQAHVNQNRPFKTIEHLGQAILLARELNDPKVATDQDILRDLIRNMRPDVLARQQASFLEPLVYAEALLNDPNAIHDKALLQQWQHEQPATLQPGALPVGTLTSLSAAAMVLEHFALRHCGAPTRMEKRAKKGLMGALIGATEAVERPVWTITQEEMLVFQKDTHGQLIQRPAPCAILTLFGQPEAIISVSLTSSECAVMVMEERAVPGVRQTGFFSTAHANIPLQSEALLSCLNSFIQQGLFVKTDQGLHYQSPARP